MTIPIRNIYYLLCYAWQRLPETGFTSKSGEEGCTLSDLFARFITHGFHRLARRGLDRGYRDEHRELPALRGRGLWLETERKQSRLRGRVVCEFEELSPDTVTNRIIKAALVLLRRDTKLDAELLSRVHACLSWLEGVTDVPLSEGMFARVQLHSGIRNYSWLLDACRLLARWHLPGMGEELIFQDVGRDEVEMRRVFEEFVRGFYMMEQTTYGVSRSNLKWAWQPGDALAQRLLPGMQTDITLRRDQQCIVIEAKYYSSSLTPNSGVHGGKLHSANLYQVHAYLTALAENQPGKLKGILLYPKVDGNIEASYRHRNYVLDVRTVDLDAPWPQIHGALIGMLG